MGLMNWRQREQSIQQIGALLLLIVAAVLLIALVKALTKGFVIVSALVTALLHFIFEGKPPFRCIGSCPFHLQ
ncbi:Nucleotide-sugar transporter family protein [Quillaja saponaria]|uniref:Nucleotide-sugar transporter family protein n=1 Tax=Quillaja saponaria TaxID=32244 RepID=A0AAD7LES1_QUISA|nr:Nucleotide-sugar transporter family protein [Quillaja saponaria]